MRGSILGASVRRVEDPRFVTGAGDYITNMVVPGALWMVPVRSSVPHGTITSVDIEGAARAPGVVGVFTAADIDADPMPIDAPDQPEVTRRPLIASDRVRFVGEIVAVVVAESHIAAIDAADLVWADIDPLPAVASPGTALAEDAPLLFPEHGSNVVLEGGTDPVGGVLDDADLVISQRIVNQRLAAVPLEANAALAFPTENGIELWVASQDVFSHRRDISKALGLERGGLVVKVPDMGGGFGAKIPSYPEQALVTYLAKHLQKPVRWHERRTESFQAMTHGRGQHQEVQLGVRRDGTITGLKVSAVQEAGAYPLYGSYLPHFTKRMASGPYAIPKIEFRWQSVATNTTPVHAYRGAGRPEATLLLERMVDLCAHELDMDPVEVRRRNLIPADAFPYVTATGERYDSGDYQAALDLALEMAGYEGLRREQAARREAGDRWQLGIGVSTYVEVTAPAGRKEWGAVEVQDDGTVIAYSGSSAHGQGHETTFAQIVAGLLRVPLDQVKVVQGDTERVARGKGTMGSRSMQMGGSAVYRAGETLVDKARQIIAHLHEASVDDVVVFDDGRVGVAGVPDTGKTWAELAELARDPANLPEGMEPGLRADDNWEQVDATVPFGAHVSVVEVDTDTGDVHLLRHVACDDCGVIFNRVVVDGQVHGGVAQGVGQGLYEQVRYDDDANLLTGNLTSYLIPTASTLPMIEVDHTETPTDLNALGAKGIGESGTIGSTAAVVNAVHDAIAHLGVRHIDMPLTSAKVWEALEAARAG